jgi:sugar/nucleoside kinase (ribokinase family)
VRAFEDAAFDIVVIGELNVDLLLYGEDVMPAFGQAEKLVDDAVLTVGSSSAIFAHQAARLGLRVAFAGKVGPDVFGEFMVDRLARASVETSAVVVDPGVKTGVTVHLIRGMDRAMLTYAGSIAALRPDEIDETLLADTRHVHLGSYFLQRGVQPGLPEVFARARETGATTSLDPGWDPEESWDSDLREVLAHTDVFLPNEQELLALVGGTILEDALESFEESLTVVVKRGDAGAVARGNGSTVTCSPPRVEAVDTTGAGDSFDAGFLFGLLKGYDLERALEAGCLCGALSTEKAGGVEAQPDLGTLRPLVNREGGENR